MASHVRTSIVAIVVLVLAVPVLFWLKSLGLVLGDPWVLALLLLLVIFVSDDRSQQQLGSGRLDVQAAAAPPCARWPVGHGALLERRLEHARAGRDGSGGRPADDAAGTSMLQPALKQS